MSQKQSKKLRNLVSSNTKSGKPTKAQINKLKKSYQALSSDVRGQFLKTLDKINQSIAQKGLDSGAAKD
jgi:flagellar motor switch protein FliM